MNSVIEPDVRDTRIRTVIVLAQLAALLLVFRVFQLETRTVFGLLCVAFAGFAVHASLPDKWRLAFFAALSVGSVPFVMGLLPGVLVLGIGIVLIAICHAPIRFVWRVLLLLAIGAGMLWVRGRTPAGSTTGAVWTLLGSMFMFRIATYLYSLKHSDAQFSVQWSLAYFFMIPNVCFPLFPIVDYKTFTRARYDSERFAIYERGTTWIFRGIVHLLLYRIVYYDLGIGELYVNDLGEIARHVAATFLLYLKVSGIFHLVVGILHLYGFRLPETHHLYFLSTSYSDFWRRINIYWKDFMMKLVYYPSFFRLRRIGNRAAVLISTVVVFVATWLLHGVYFYFLTGTRLFTKNDLAFWGLFALLVVGTTVWETRPGRRAARNTRKWSLSRGIATVATVGSIAILWSLWNSESLTTWAYMWSLARYSTARDYLVLSGMLIAAIAISGYAWGMKAVASPPKVRDPLREYGRRGALRIAAMLVLLTIALPQVQHASVPHVAELVSHLRGIGDALEYQAGQDVGYYEALAPEKPKDPALWVQPRVGNPAKLDTSPVFERRTDFAVDGLRPNVSTTWLGKPFTTNQWGMRDRDYALEKPADTYRIALMGPSDAIGWGVADNEMYAALMEPMLDSIARVHGKRVEVLNFALSGHSLVQEVFTGEQNAARFSPDLMVYVAQQFDLAFYKIFFRTVVARNLAIPDTGIARILKDVNIQSWMTDVQMMRALRPVQEQLDRRAFQWANEIGKRVGATAIVLMVKLPEHRGDGTQKTIRRAAADAGLSTLECTRVFDGLVRPNYSLASNDRHPNAAGHQLIAQCVVNEIIAHGAALRFPMNGSPNP